MLREKVRIEIYEGNPFTGCCGPGVISANSDEMMKMLVERNKIVKALEKEFKNQIDVERVIVSSRRPYSTYPSHVYKLLMARTRMPFVLINGELASEGEFFSYSAFKKLIVDHINRPIIMD